MFEKTKTEADRTATKGYVCLVDHALAQSEVCVRQVGESLQQNLRGHVSLEVSWVELVPAGPEAEPLSSSRTPSVALTRARAQLTASARPGSPPGRRRSLWPVCPRTAPM